jgi:thiamine-monophosphate kinase
VTGTIGDGALGLLAARGNLPALSARQRAHIEDRYRLPRPRCTLAPRLPGIVTAMADVSDGLLADAGHIADASRLAVSIERDDVPLSPAARKAVAADPRLWAIVLGGGDDYELVMSVPGRRRAALQAAAKAAGLRITCIGRFVSGGGVSVNAGGRAIEAPCKGYVHF